MDNTLQLKAENAVWVSHSLFARNKTSGSSANISFRHNNTIYISASGTCLGTISADDFVPLSLDGQALSDQKPSKEWPLHIALYQKSESIGAVIHTHSTYSVLWSFIPAADETDVIPDHTPYLRMKLGSVGFVPYAAPGSEALFQAFRSRIHDSDGFILKKHGPVVPGKDILDAFYCLEELEESAHIAWELNRAGIAI
ncbi:class II aldolase/adducin family protein [Oribacterium sp. HCP28S3_H8]|jgi:L-ribulose-5-phosphate 4-epimerase|uniref:class II aldolase/adducin family protein n=1 Tax=Oribacterium sp. HCP28S3_H8 TaxID=3438945 RepID=UPI003F8A6CBA